MKSLARVNVYKYQKHYAKIEAVLQVTSKSEAQSNLLSQSLTSPQIFVELDYSESAKN